MKLAVFSHIAQKQTCSVGQRLNEFVDEAALADDLGFDYMFTTEHHFSERFSLSPTQSVSLALLAQATKRIRFGPLIVILPITQPLRVVEEMMILDHYSGGRLELGFGRGITPHEHITYGVDPAESAERHDEALAFILQAIESREPFDFEGKYYKYTNVALPWRFLQEPSPRIWAPTNTPGSAYGYGKTGWGSGGFGVLGADLYDTVFSEYRRGWAESGRPESDNQLSYLTSVYVAETDAEARETMYENFDRQMDLFKRERELSRDATTGELSALQATSLARLQAMTSDLVKADEDCRFICGSPDTVTAKIEALNARLGFKTYIGEFSFGELTYEQVQRSYELFAGKVMPTVKKL